MEFKAKVTRVEPWNIYHFEFNTLYEMNATLIRIQEFYECKSPHIQNQIFTLDDYMDWHAENHDGVFDYFENVYGINIPGHVFDNFFEVYKESELRQREIWFWNLLQAHIDVECSDLYYVIASVKGDSDNALDHEIRHGVWYIEPEYRKAMEYAISKHRIAGLKSYLRDMNYGENVINDEIHAFTLTGWPDNFEPTKECFKLKKRLHRIEKRYIDDQAGMAKT